MRVGSMSRILKEKESRSIRLIGGERIRQIDIIRSDHGVIVVGHG